MRRALLLLILVLAGADRAGAQTFTHVESLFDGVGSVDGLNFAWTTTVSPDGNNVYVCSGVGNVGAPEDDNAIAVFSRDEATGKLTFVETEFDDDDIGDPGTADGLLSCRDAVVSSANSTPPRWASTCRRA